MDAEQILDCRRYAEGLKGFVDPEDVSAMTILDLCDALEQAQADRNSALRAKATDYVRRMEALEAENARLREALEKIAMRVVWYADDGSMTELTYGEVVDEARRALEKG